MFVLIIILKVVLYILLFIIGLFILLLLVPFSYSGQLLTAYGLAVQVRLGWAWSLLGIKAEIEGETSDIALCLFDRKILRFKSQKTAVEEKSEEYTLKEKKPKKDKGRFSFKELTDRTLINEILEYIKRVLKIAKPKYLHLYGTYGFEDPSITGIICGITGMLEGILPQARVQLNPDFTQEIIDVDIRAEGSVVVGSLAYQTIRTVLKKPIRRIVFKRRKR